MSGNRNVPSGTMESGGAYNKYGKLPAGGGALALPHLEKAARRLSLTSDNRPIVIADYGSSQGKNSLAPVQLAIDTLRTRVGLERPIMVYHEDLVANDFNELFDTLSNDPRSYLAIDRNTFACGIGRSFYENVLPPNYVDLGWCSYAAMWISRIPILIPNHFCVFRSEGDVRLAFNLQGAADWEAFLSLRARELQYGGRLVVVVPGADERGWSGYEEIMDCANECLADMVIAAEITVGERGRMIVGVWPRRRAELTAPFSENGAFHELFIEDCDTMTLTDPAWSDFEHDNDKDALARKQALFFRTIFAPTLSRSLDVQDPRRIEEFLENIEKRLGDKRSREPHPINSFVETIVLAKTRST